MSEEPKEIRGGVIIQGSLFWEDEKNCVQGKEDIGKLRRKWREENLDCSKFQSISLPIRYGRFSEWDNRRNTYTMVLSSNYLTKTKIGKALAVPFKKEFDFSDKRILNKQLKRLSRVELIANNNNKYRLAAFWGAIAIWVNPISKHSKFLNDYWRKNIIRNPTNEYANKNYNWSDGTLLNNEFQIQLDLESNFDFLLCTYILPKYERGDRDSPQNRTPNKGYPSPKMIGEAISISKYSTYFCQNRVSGITTSDDEEIFKHIK